MALISGLTGRKTTTRRISDPPPAYKPIVYNPPQTDPYAGLGTQFRAAAMEPAKQTVAPAPWKYGTNTDEGDLNWIPTGSVFGGGGGTNINVDFPPGDGGSLFPSSGPSGPSSPPGVSWSEFDSGLAGPDWWKALKPSEMTRETEQLANMNLLIPLLSPEDQRQVAQAIYNADPKNFAHLNPEDKDFFPPPGVGRGIREKFQDMGRAESGLAALTKLASATGTDEASQGAGTRFLRNILDQMQDFTRPGQQSRQQFMEMMGSVAPTIAGATTEQKPFTGLARMLSQPFFSTGSLMKASRTKEGKYIFGRPSKELYF